MSAFHTNKHIDFWIRLFMIAGDVIHFSNPLFSSLKAFLFHKAGKVKFKKGVWLDLERKIQNFSSPISV
jgi:hypothetical protein